MKPGQKNKNRSASAPASKGIPCRRKIIEDLEKIFELSMETGKLNTALRAKVDIGKELGLFRPVSKRTKFSLLDLSEDELEEMLEEALALEAEKREGKGAIALDNDRIQVKIGSQKDLYAAKHLQREQENLEFEKKRCKFYGPAEG